MIVFRFLALGLSGFVLIALTCPSAVASANWQTREIEPRIWECTFESAALRKSGGFLVVLPDMAKTVSGTDRRFPVIYFLHGRGRNEHSLIEVPAVKARLLASPCAVVLPRGDDGWYINSPERPADRYADYLDEIIRLAEKHFPVSNDPQHRAIGGWSMGGYGAAMTVVRRPHDFRALATIIGLLDFPRIPIDDPTQNYTVPVARFGQNVQVWARLNPRLHATSFDGVSVLLVIGEKAFDRQMNEAFITAVTDTGNPPRVIRLPGGHSFSVVTQAIPAVFGFFEERLR